jgi:hypothetical protein
VLLASKTTQGENKMTTDISYDTLLMMLREFKEKTKEVKGATVLPAGIKLSLYPDGSGSVIATVEGLVDYYSESDFPRMFVSFDGQKELITILTATDTNHGLDWSVY